MIDMSSIEKRVFYRDVSIDIRDRKSVLRFLDDNNLIVKHPEQLHTGFHIGNIFVMRKSHFYEFILFWMLVITIYLGVLIGYLFYNGIHEVLYYSVLSVLIISLIFIMSSVSENEKTSPLRIFSTPRKGKEWVECIDMCKYPKSYMVLKEAQKELISGKDDYLLDNYHDVIQSVIYLDSTDQGSSKRKRAIKLLQGNTQYLKKILRNDNPREVPVRKQRELLIDDQIDVMEAKLELKFNSGIQ